VVIGAGRVADGAGVLELLVVVVVVVVVGTSGLMAVEAVITALDALHVHNLILCCHSRQPVRMVSPVPHAPAEVNHGYGYVQCHRPGQYAYRHTSGVDADHIAIGMGENRAVVEAVLYLVEMVVGQASD
jgi:hypothetical protein